MSAFVIHAGLPKTGTTYLQQRFVDNREWLARHGVHYPTAGQEVGPGHHSLAMAFRSEAAVDLHEMCATDCERVLLSSETFSSLHPQEASALKSAIGDQQVTYVLHLRRRSALAFSRWQEEVKHGSVRSFAEFLAAQLIGTGGALRIGEAVEVALRAFGPEALRIVILEELQQRKVDIFEHFCEHILALDPTDAVATGRDARNASLPPPLVEALRAVNAGGASGALWASGRERFAQAALQWLTHTPDGQALLADVTTVCNQHADELPVDGLDQQWLHRDHMILGACRDQILNASGEWQLFPDGSAKPVRALRPSVLYECIPFARFADAAKAIADPVHTDRP